MDFSAYHNPKGVNIGYVDGSVRFYNFVDDNLPETVYQGYTWGLEGPNLTSEVKEASSTLEPAKVVTIAVMLVHCSIVEMVAPRLRRADQSSPSKCR